MEDKIVLRIAFEVLKNASMDNIIKALKLDGFYNFIQAEDNRSPIGVFRSDTLLPNRTLIGHKKIEDDEISQIHSIGESFVRERIGITKVWSRQYRLQPKKLKLKDFIHTIIMLITTISIVGGINHVHHGIIGWIETSLIIGVPTGIEFLYAIKNIKK